MSVRKNIRFPLTFKGLAADEATRRVDEAARLVHVEELMDRLPGQMSGGQQQRVALARALVKEPQLLLLDEPLSNLDATLRLSMRAEIRRLQRRLGVTTVLVTHDQIEATTMADRIVCMSKGRIEQIGTADDLYQRPNKLFVASFIGAPPINLLEGRGSGGKLQVGELSLAAPGVEGAVVLGIRPEHLTLHPPADGARLPGEISTVEPLGRETLYEVTTPLGSLRVLEAGSERRFREADPVAVAVPDEALLVFDKASERRLEQARLVLTEAA